MGHFWWKSSAQSQSREVNAPRMVQPFTIKLAIEVGHRFACPLLAKDDAVTSNGEIEDRCKDTKRRPYAPPMAWSRPELTETYTKGLETWGFFVPHDQEE